MFIHDMSMIRLVLVSKFFVLVYCTYKFHLVFKGASKKIIFVKEVAFKVLNI